MKILLNGGPAHLREMDVPDELPATVDVPTGEGDILVYERESRALGLPPLDYSVHTPIYNFSGGGWAKLEV